MPNKDDLTLAQWASREGMTYWNAKRLRKEGRLKGAYLQAGRYFVPKSTKRPKAMLPWARRGK